MPAAAARPDLDPQAVNVLHAPSDRPADRQQNNPHWVALGTERAFSQNIGSILGLYIVTGRDNGARGDAKDGDRINRSPAKEMIDNRHLWRP